MYWDGNTEMVVVTNYLNSPNELRWLREMFPESPIMAYHKGVEIPNHGHEASTYLKFLSEHYNNLPQSVMFLHGHYKSWHQDNFFLRVLPKYLRINNNYEKHPYLNVCRAHIDNHRIGIHPAMDLLETLWQKYFEPYFKTSCPHYLSHMCCAQFIVQRPTIHIRPQEAYQKWYELSINEQYDSKLISNVFEFLWHSIFGEPYIINPIELFNLFASIENVKNLYINKNGG